MMPVTEGGLHEDFILELVMENWTLLTGCENGKDVHGNPRVLRPPLTCPSFVTLTHSLLS